MDSMQELYIPDNLDNPALKKVVPAELLDWYRTGTGTGVQAGTAAGRLRPVQLPDEQIATLLKGPISRSERTVRYLAEIGHDLLLASDHTATPGMPNTPV